jgi:hypothetical protein
MVSSFSATAAQMVTILGRLAREGKTDEAIQRHAQLTEIVAKILSVVDTLSIDKLRRQREHSRNATSRG